MKTKTEDLETQAQRQAEIIREFKGRYHEMSRNAQAQVDLLRDLLVGIRCGTSMGASCPQPNCDCWACDITRRANRLLT